MEPPNCVPHGPFSLQIDDGDDARLLGCCHGLVLIYHASRNRLLVWDPVTSDKHSLALPPGFDTSNTLSNGAVLRAAGGVQHFQVVIVYTEKQQQYARAITRVYSSETGMWGNLVSTPLSPKASSSVNLLPDINMVSPSVLVGDSLYWLLSRSPAGILEFDFNRQRLAVIPVPVDMYADGNSQFSVMRADGGGLGFVFLSKFSAQLWKRKIDSDGVASWVLARTIELDKLLSLNSEKGGWPPTILGFAEYNNVVFLWTGISLFMIQLESLQIKKLFKTKYWSRYHSFESVYAAGTCIGGGHGGAELLHNT